MKYLICRSGMTIGHVGDIVTRERTNMSDKGLAKAVEVGILVEIYEPGDDEGDDGQDDLP